MTIPLKMCQFGDGCSQCALPSTCTKGLCYDGLVLHVPFCSLVVALSLFHKRLTNKFSCASSEVLKIIKNNQFLCSIFF